MEKNKIKCSLKACNPKKKKKTLNKVIKLGHSFSKWHLTPKN